MIDREKASEIADEHIVSMGEPANGYRFKRGDPINVDTDWYFDLIVVCDLDIPEQEQEKFAGAFGFVVNKKSGVVSGVSYSQWMDLGLAFHSKPYGD